MTAGNTSAFPDCRWVQFGDRLKVRQPEKTWLFMITSDWAGETILLSISNTVEPRYKEGVRRFVYQGSTA